MSGVRLDAADNQDARIFVGNVAPGTDEDLVMEHFKKHGTIKGVVVLKGFAFVQVRILF
jgi:RNA recognition motif-containing protein